MHFCKAVTKLLLQQSCTSLEQIALQCNIIDSFKARLDMINKTTAILQTIVQ